MRRSRRAPSRPHRGWSPEREVSGDETEAVVGAVEQLVGGTAEPVERHRVDRSGVDHAREIAVDQVDEVELAHHPATLDRRPEQELQSTVAVVGAERAVLGDPPSELGGGHHHHVVGVTRRLDAVEEPADAGGDVGEQLVVAIGLVGVGVEAADPDRDHPGADAELDDAGGVSNQRGFARYFFTQTCLDCS